MFTTLAITTIHSAGINWGQALATWVPIVLGLLTLFGLITKAINGSVERAIKAFADGLNIKFNQIDNHLSDQDKRFDRVDRNTGGDSR